MTIVTRLYTVDEFFDFITQPENQTTHYELIGGEIFEVVSEEYASQVGGRFFRYVDIFVEEHELGIVTGADGGYMVMGQPYIPDTAFMSFKRQTKKKAINGYNVLAPDLAVEVRSPTDRDADITLKITNYIQAGTVVWDVNADKRTVTVYAKDQAPIKLTSNDTLDGGDALPGFSVPVEKLFPVRREVDE